MITITQNKKIIWPVQKFSLQDPPLDGPLYNTYKNVMCFKESIPSQPVGGEEATTAKLSNQVH